MESKHRRTVDLLSRRFSRKFSQKRIEVTAETELSSLLDDAGTEPLLLERDGEVFRLERTERRAYDPDRERVLRTLEETVGKYPDPDVEAAIAAVYEGRRLGSRPPGRP